MKKFRFLAVVMAVLMAILGFATPAAYATGTGSGTGTIGTDTPDTPDRGVLSGYAYYNYTAGNTSDGSFPLYVSGSWSPFAGWTAKTSFASGSYITLYLTRPDGSQIGNGIQLNPTDEVTNMSLWNVPTGTYYVHYSIYSSVSGTIEVWIY